MPTAQAAPHKNLDPNDTQRLHDRLARLEENLYFQETTIQELNQALTQQQHQIDTLELQLKRAVEKLNDVYAMANQGPEATVPPHSVSLKY